MAGSAVNFVHIIEQYPCLYNNKLPEYSRKDITDRAWSEIAQKTNASAFLALSIASKFSLSPQSNPDGRLSYKTYYFVFFLSLILRVSEQNEVAVGEFILNTSDPQPTQNLDINTAAVSGITNVGIGLKQFQGLCVAMNLPTMTQQMYRKKHTEICDQWEKTAHAVMDAERENLTAIEEGTNLKLK
ncbi:unnamed protein product [Colias eurytheme]|nr:unnamed protein product [Colias eurytheme]